MLIMHHVVALIAERLKGTCTNWPLSGLLNVMCLKANACCKTTIKLGSHWKHHLYSYGVEVRLSTSYPTHPRLYLSIAIGGTYS
ncbi:hypothetical protein Hanom_Chr03g00209551 [Helianthus anomalus]